MAAADDREQTALPLPGLDEPRTGTPSQLELAARRSIAALAAAGVLTEAHAVSLELVLALARAVDRATTKGQGAAAAMAAAQLREAWAQLPAIDTDGGGLDDWQLLARQLRKAHEDERRRHAAALGA